MLTRAIKIPETLDFFLFGARSTGKSTLLRQIFSEQNTATFDLLNPQVLEQFQDRPQAFRQALLGLPPHLENVIVDEIQRVPALLDLVQEFMGQKRFRFILTGSSARKLKRGHANLLGGRAVKRELWPLTHREIDNTPEALQLKMKWGGLPQIFLAASDEERKDLLRTYVSTYLAEEIVAEQLVRNLAPFRKFLAVAAQMNGKIINTNSIGKDVGTSHNTVGSYFEILEETLIGFSLPAYATSVRTRIRAKNKFYLFDTGVCRALSRSLDATILPGTSAYGELFEHMIICEIKSIASYLKPDWELYYLQTISGAEIDLVIDTGISKPILVEIKSTDDISRVSLTSEIALMEDFDASARYVLSQDTVTKALTPQVRSMHWLQGISEIFQL